MALRVLLGDESPAIKKVIQIALKDFGVDVKAVPVGIDVPEVARQFRPDIVFLDVLLQKRSGYDIAKDLKEDPELHSIPVVLIWSAFMDLDQKKMAAARPDGQLEKPFDAEGIRSLVKKLVPATANNPVSKHLKFPELPEIKDDEPESFTVAPLRTAAEIERMSQAAASAPEDGDADNWTMESFEDIPLPQNSNEVKTDENWIQKDLTQFRTNVPENEEELAVPMGHDAEEITISGRQPAPLSQAAVPQLTAQQLEAIVRAQSKEVIEKIAMKLVPELATRIIREELQRLVDEPRL